jgi:hypothetical protein
VALHRLVTILCFVAYLLLAFLIVDDYGISWDEAVQRRHGHVTLSYVADRLGIPHRPFDTQGKGFSPYGMIYQIMATGLERVFGLEDDRYAFYQLRHRLNFLLFALALVFFYRTLRIRWPLQRWYPLIGCTVLVITPRIFAHSFFNPKDHILLVFYLIATYTLFQFLRRRSWRNLLWHALASSLALNARYPALIILGATVAILLWEQLRERPGNWRRLAQVAVYLPVTLLLMLPLFPYLWAAPAERLTSSVVKMANYTWDSTNLLYGEYLRAVDLPWYYIPVWIGITTPLPYLFFILVGCLLVGGRSLVRLRSLRFWQSPTEQYDFVQLGLSVGPILVIILLGSTVYNGWRHLHFVYPGLVYLLLVGFYQVDRRSPYLSRFVLLAAISITGARMARMHPHQNVFFNDLIRNESVVKDFDMDYWGVGYRDAFLQLAEQIPEGETRRVKCQNWPCQDNINSLPPGPAEKLILVHTWDADFVATNFLYPEEKQQLTDREIHYATPTVEIAPRGNVSIGIYPLK